MTEDTREKENVLNKGKKIILDIPIWKSIQDWVFASIYWIQIHLKRILQILSISTTNFFFPKKYYLFENKQFFLVSWNNNQYENKK